MRGGTTWPGFCLGKSILGGVEVGLWEEGCRGDASEGPRAPVPLRLSPPSPPSVSHDSILLPVTQSLSTPQ